MPDLSSGSGILLRLFTGALSDLLQGRFLFPVFAKTGSFVPAPYRGALPSPASPGRGFFCLFCGGLSKSTVRTTGRACAFPVPEKSPSPLRFLCLHRPLRPAREGFRQGFPTHAKTPGHSLAGGSCLRCRTSAARCPVRRALRGDRSALQQVADGALGDLFGQPAAVGRGEQLALVVGIGQKAALHDDRSKICAVEHVVVPRQGLEGPAVQLVQAVLNGAGGLFPLRTVRPEKDLGALPLAGGEFVQVQADHQHGGGGFDDLPPLFHVPPLEAVGGLAVQAVGVLPGQDHRKAVGEQRRPQLPGDQQIELALRHPGGHPHGPAVDAAVTGIQHDGHARLARRGPEGAGRRQQTHRAAEAERADDEDAFFECDDRQFGLAHRTFSPSLARFLSKIPVFGQSYPLIHRVIHKNTCSCGFRWTTPLPGSRGRKKPFRGPFGVSKITGKTPLSSSSLCGFPRCLEHLPALALRRKMTFPRPPSRSPPMWITFPAFKPRL